MPIQTPITAHDVETAFMRGAMKIIRHTDTDGLALLVGPDTHVPLLDAETETQLAGMSVLDCLCARTPERIIRDTMASFRRVTSNKEDRGRLGDAFYNALWNSHTMPVMLLQHSHLPDALLARKPALKELVRTGSVRNRIWPTCEILSMISVTDVHPGNEDFWCRDHRDRLTRVVICDGQITRYAGYNSDTGHVVALYIDVADARKHWTIGIGHSGKECLQPVTCYTRDMPGTGFYIPDDVSRRAVSPIGLAEKEVMP